jgi:hypothetical protein
LAVEVLHHGIRHHADAHGQRIAGFDHPSSLSLSMAKAMSSSVMSGWRP